MADQVSIGKVNKLPNNTPGRAGFAVDRSDGRIKVKRGGTLVLEPIAATGLVNQTAAAVTLKAKDDGLTVAANSASTVVVTLPLAKAGLVFRILTQQLPGSGAGTTITPNAADKFQGNGFNAKTAGQTLVNSSATDAIGDFIDLQGTDSNIWFVVGKVGTWA